LEIRAAEGGADAKMFVEDLKNMYYKFFNKMGFCFKEAYKVFGEIHIEVTGDNAYN